MGWKRNPRWLANLYAVEIAAVWGHLGSLTSNIFYLSTVNGLADLMPEKQDCMIYSEFFKFWTIFQHHVQNSSGMELATQTQIPGNQVQHAIFSESRSKMVKNLECLAFF